MPVGAASAGWGAPWCQSLHFQHLAANTDENLSRCLLFVLPIPIPQWIRIKSKPTSSHSLIIDEGDPDTRARGSDPWCQHPPSERGAPVSWSLPSCVGLWLCLCNVYHPHPLYIISAWETSSHYQHHYQPSVILRRGARISGQTGAARVLLKISTKLADSNN